MCDYLKSIAGWNLDGSLGLHWMERDMANGVRSVNGSVIALCPDQSVKTARYFRIVFHGKQAILKIGPGDHTVQEWELDKDQLRGLVLDALPELLR